MRVTKVTIRKVDAMPDKNGCVLLAYCTVVFDGELVIYDFKLINGMDGLFVAMPTRKITDRCPKCGTRNDLTSRYCSNCGEKLPENRAANRQAFADLLHPINKRGRQIIHDAIIAAYESPDSAT